VRELKKESSEALATFNREISREDLVDIVARLCQPLCTVPIISGLRKDPWVYNSQGSKQIG